MSLASVQSKIDADTRSAQVQALLLRLLAHWILPLSCCARRALCRLAPTTLCCTETARVGACCMLHQLNTHHVMRSIAALETRTCSILSARNPQASTFSSSTRASPPTPVGLRESVLQAVPSAELIIACAALAHQVLDNSLHAACHPLSLLNLKPEHFHPEVKAWAFHLQTPETWTAGAG